MERDEEPTREMPRGSPDPRDAETTPSEPEAPPPEIPGFTILRKLGQGGQGAVYLAVSQDGLSKRAAVKVFPREAKASYARELEAWRRVEEIRRSTATPHLVEGYSAGSTRDGYTFVAMAFFERGSLADRLIADGPFSPQEGVRYARHVLSALELLHQDGLFHRDVKPQNVFLGTDGIARLGDYGLSKPLGTSVTGSCTPAFAAPEQLAGEEDADGKKIDIYGVGAMLFALLTGKAPVPGRPDVFLLERRKVPRPIHAALFRALSPYPNLRYSEAAEFQKALAQAEPVTPGGGGGNSEDVDQTPISVTALDKDANEQLRAIARAETVAFDEAHGDQDPARKQRQPNELGGHTTTAGRRSARARGLLVLAAIFCALPFVVDALRSAPFGRKDDKDIALTGSGTRATASPTEIAILSTRTTPVVPTTSFSIRRAPLSLENVRFLAAGDQSLALVQSRSVAIYSGKDELLVLETPGIDRAVAFGPERALVSSRDGDLSLVSAIAGEKTTLVLPGEGRRLLALAAHAGTRQIALASESDGVSWFRLLEGDERAPDVCVLTEPHGVVTDLAFDERGERLAVAAIAKDGAGRIAIYRLWRGAPWVETVVDTEGPLALAWLSRNALAVGDLQGSVSILDAKSGARGRTFDAAAFEVQALARLSRNDTLLVLGDDRRLEPGVQDGAVWIHDAEGAAFSFPKKKKPRLLAYRIADLLAGGGEPAPLALDPGAFDPAGLR